MKAVRIGIIGIGNMGSHHLKTLMNKEVNGATVTAVCDTNPARLEWSRSAYPGVATFGSTGDFFAKAPVDAILVATPHYQHPDLAIAGFKKGLHVMVEKPAGVYTKQVHAMNAAAKKSKKVFGIMFNQRTIQTHQKMREMVRSGELGTLRRVNWIITNWFRPQSYYDSGGWRATWAGEGGGVLVNQCPHNLDLFQWICGMPKRIRAFCYCGKYDRIEVEDDVTAFMEFEDGATGLFVTSTGEAPGANRFEIVGDRGTMVNEHGQLTFYRNRVPMDEYLRTSQKHFSGPECWKITLESGGGDQHRGILQNWTDAILKGKPLLGPGPEGINSVEIANAIMLSAWTDDWATLPVDEDLFLKLLQKRIKASGARTQKKGGGGKVADVNGSF